VEGFEGVKKKAKKKRRWSLIQEKRKKRREKPRNPSRRKRRKKSTHVDHAVPLTRSQAKRRVRKLKKRGLRFATLRIPKIFSFIDNPVQTLETIEALRRAIVPPSTKELKIDHSRCKKLDLCASVIMDVTLLQAQARRKGNQLNLAGTYSGDIDVNMMLRGSGILKQISHPDSILPEEVEATIRTCDLFSGKASKIERSRKCDEAATKLTDYFNECLRMEKFELSSSGKFRLSSLVTEVIGNAEEHGGRWYTIAYFRQSDEQLGHCHIALFNFGRTIYESLWEDAASEELKSRIDALIRKHQDEGLLRSLLHPTWEEESLVTLYALQEGVSRLSFTKKGIDRGNGTVNMIEFFNQLAGGSQRMCLISGKTYILFDGEYDLHKTMLESGEERRVIAFNKRNNLDEPPDRNHVRTLPVGFPGTIISIRFDLDRSNLERLAKR
jgi:hypothetical protein